MANSLNHGDVSTSNTDIDLAWNSYYPILKSFVWRLVLSYSVARWKGQEDDIVDDIMQETAYRIIERNRKAQRGDATPIYVLEHMATTIAINHCKDIRRRDRRLIHIFADCPVGADAVEPDYENVNISEIATEGAYRQALFLALAQEIAQSPEKQRQVLLCDLANHMSF